jgi:hypothetical protein
VIGCFQFTHYAAWQASMAIRTMLFPGSTGGLLEGVMPRHPRNLACQAAIDWATGKA